MLARSHISGSQFAQTQTTRVKSSQLHHAATLPYSYPHFLKHVASPPTSRCSHSRGTALVTINNAPKGNLDVDALLQLPKFPIPLSNSPGNSTSNFPVGILCYTFLRASNKCPKCFPGTQSHNALYFLHLRLLSQEWPGPSKQTCDSGFIARATAGGFSQSHIDQPLRRG